VRRCQERVGDDGESDRGAADRTVGGVSERFVGKRSRRGSCGVAWGRRAAVQLLASSAGLGPPARGRAAASRGSAAARVWPRRRRLLVDGCRLPAGPLTEAELRPRYHWAAGHRSTPTARRFVRDESRSPSRDRRALDRT